MTSPLLMIPGPIEISDGVRRAAGVAPPSHVAPGFIEDFGRALELMRYVWCAAANSQPFIIAGSGTLAMEMAVYNVVEPGDAAVVVNSGYFSDRMGEMLRRRGVAVTHVECAPGAVPDLEAVEAAIASVAPALVCATHVDTSTGVRVDAGRIAALAKAHGALSVFDGVCATAAERFEMEAWGADIYLTASQKAIGLPAGLALMVASAPAMARRAALKTPPPMYLDWDAWTPIMKAYEARRPSYFGTPATTLVGALRLGLDEILAADSDPAQAMEARFALHQRSADAMRAAWSAMGLSLVPTDPNTLSAVRYPEGVDATLPGLIKAQGVVVAGGLHPAIKTEYFRVGHMGHVLERPEALERTVEAVGTALNGAGFKVDVGTAKAALWAVLGEKA